MEGAPDLARIIKNGSIVVAMHQKDSAPFFMTTSSGQLIGLDVEMARDIASKIGVKVNFLRTAKTFDELLDQVEAGKADVAISRISITPRRALRVQYTNAYATLTEVLLVNRIAQAQRGRGPDSIEFLDNKGVTMGVVAGNAYSEFTKANYPNAELKIYKDFDEMYVDVARGNLSAVLHQDVTVSDWEFRNPKYAIQVHKIILPDKLDPKAMAVNWKNENLLHWLNSYLDVIRYDGTLSGWMTKYVKTNEWRRK